MYETGSFAEGYAIGRDTNGNNGMWGQDSWWILIILFALWGNNGFGGFGNQSGYGYVDSAIQRGFDNQTVVNKLNGLENGLCSLGYDIQGNLSTGFAGVQQTLCQGFSGINTAIMTQGYESRLATQGLSSQLASCCCDISRGIDGVNYNLAKSTCDIIRAGQDNTSRIIDFLTQEKICSLQAENSKLTAQLSQNAQSRYIIDELKPVAKPAYITCSPYQSVYGYGYNGCGFNNFGCGNVQ